MNQKLTLQLGGSILDFNVRRVVVAGYTGRDTNQVHAHIEELEKQGIPAPETVPSVYPLDASWATIEKDLAVGDRVSGEVEPALLFVGNSLDDALVSVIVDFTDREEEKKSIAESKKQPKPFSSQVWRYGDVAEFWDEIALRSWVEPGPKPQLYQSGTFAQLLPPATLLESIKPRLEGDLEGTVLLMGTVPLLSKQFLFTDYFGCEIETPKHAKLSYECRLRHSDAR